MRSASEDSPSIRICASSRLFRVCRPRPHRPSGDPNQVFARRSGTSLKRHPLQCVRQETGKSVYICFRAELMRSLSCFQPQLKRIHYSGTPCVEVVSQRFQLRRAVVESERQHAAKGLVLTGELVGGRFQEFMKGNGGWLDAIKNVARIAAFLCLVLIQGR